jgi:hypothetical protein
VSGLLTGVFAVGLSKVVHLMFDWKNGYIQSLLDEPGGGGRVWVAFLWHCAYSCCLVSFGVALVGRGEGAGGGGRLHGRAHARAHGVPHGGRMAARHRTHPAAAAPPRSPDHPARPQVQYWAPQSAGAGVILVMAYLNGNHVPNLLRLRTLVTKFVGTVCAVASGLPFGPEGPMVHMGACVASVITYAQCSESPGGGGEGHGVSGAAAHAAAAAACGGADSTRVSWLLPTGCC